MLENYNLLITALKSFNDFGTECNEDNETVIETYNSFPCNTPSEIQEYGEYLESLYEKAFFEIKKTMDDFLIKTNGFDLAKVFLNSKVDDFQNLSKIIEKRNEKITKDKCNYSYYDEIEDEFAQCFERELYLIKRGEELYYRNSITLQDLVSEDEFSSLKSLGSLKAIVSHIVMEKYQRDLTQKMHNQLQELQKVYSFAPQEEVQKSLKKSSTHKIEKDFRSYLHHNNKDALIEKLHELLDGNKGKVVAITIKALEKLNFIAVLSQRATLYKSMEKEFGDIGAPQGLNKFYSELNLIDTKNLKLKQLNEELQHQIEILSKV